MTRTGLLLLLLLLLPLPPQVKGNGLELGSLPACVVGEFSCCRPPGCSLSTTTFFEAELKTYHRKSTHGLFFWTWSDGAGVDVRFIFFEARALCGVPGNSLEYACAYALRMSCFTPSPVLPSQSQWALKDVDVDKRAAIKALSDKHARTNAAWTPGSPGSNSGGGGGGGEGRRRSLDGESPAARPRPPKFHLETISSYEDDVLSPKPAGSDEGGAGGGGGGARRGTWFGGGGSKLASPLGAAGKGLLAGSVGEGGGGGGNGGGGAADDDDDNDEDSDDDGDSGDDDDEKDGK